MHVMIIKNITEVGYGFNSKVKNGASQHLIQVIRKFDFMVMQ